MSMAPERDEELTRLYREAAQAEPPVRLDAAILAAAREAAARPARDRSRPWWQRWAVPMSVTAVALLSASLTLLVSREQERAEQPPPAAAESAPAIPGDRVPEAELRREPVLQPPAAPVSRPRPIVPREAEVSQQRPAENARQAEPAGPAFAPDPLQRRDAAPQKAERSFEAMPEQRAPSAAASSADTAAEQAADAIPAQREASGAAAPARPAGAAIGRAKGMAPDGAAKEQLGFTPGQWVEQIRTLLRQGREAEALQALRALRRAHPDHLLPPDLQALTGTPGGTLGPAPPGD